jgi:hypothetical protein
VVDEHLEDQNVVTLGGGGKLYKDARDADRRLSREEDTARGAGKPKQPEPAPQPPWTVQPVRPEPVALPPSQRDWHQVESTLVELLGISLVTGGVAMWSIPAAMIVAGVFILLLGVAAGLPEKKPKP